MSNITGRVTKSSPSVVGVEFEGTKAARGVS